MGDYINFKQGGGVLDRHGKSAYLAEVGTLVGHWDPRAGEMDFQDPDVTIVENKYRDIDKIADGHRLIAVAKNPGFEAALVMNEQRDFNTVWPGIESGIELRPVSFYLIKSELAEEMTGDLLP